MNVNQKILMATLIVCSMICVATAMYENSRVEQVNTNKNVDIEGYEQETDYYTTTKEGYRISNSISDSIEDEQVRFILSALTKYNYYVDSLSDNYEGIYLYKKDYNVKELDNNFKLYVAINSLYESNLFTSTNKSEYDKYEALSKINGAKVKGVYKTLFGTNEFDKKINNWLSPLELVYEEKDDIYYLIDNKNRDNTVKSRYIVTKTINTEETEDKYVVTEAVAFVDSKTHKAYKDYLDNEVGSEFESETVFELNDDNIDNFPKFAITFKKDNSRNYHFESIILRA